MGPFEILEKVRVVAYRLALSPSLIGVHNIFHISVLRKYVPDSNYMVEFEPLQLRKDLFYKEQSMRVMDRKE